MKTKTESEMNFQYDPNLVFLPEENEPYKTLNKSNGIKTCDFIWLDPIREKVYFIEAKTTSPRDFRDRNAIHWKFVHSLGLYISMLENRQPSTLPMQFNQKLNVVQIIPLLIVKNDTKDMCIQLESVMRKEIKGTQKAFKLEDLHVYTKEIANTKGFIS